jgi:hypothetical protein
VEKFERRLEAINVGRMTSLAMQEMAPMLREQRETTISQLTQNFRAGKRAEELYAHIAVLVAIEDLENQARSKIRMGETASREQNAESAKS